MSRGYDLSLAPALIQGKRSPEEHILKEISSLLYRLPATSSPEFATQFEDSWGSGLLASLFTEILKGTENIQDVTPFRF